MNMILYLMFIDVTIAILRMWPPARPRRRHVVRLAQGQAGAVERHSVMAAAVGLAC